MPITKPPRRNLPGAAEQWGRYVDDKIRQSQVDTEALRRDLTSGLRASNSSMSRIASQQAALEAQQAELAHQQDQILEALDSVIIPQYFNWWEEDFPVTPTLTDRVNWTFTVPDGCTVAMVNASMAFRANNTNSVGDWLIGAVEISGNISRYAVISGPANTWASGSCFYARRIEGLTPGDPVHIGGLLGVQGSSSWATNGSFVSITGTTFFLR